MTGADVATAETEADAQRRRRRIENLKGHARILAERGEPAERSWPPEVVDAYGEAMREAIGGLLNRANGALAKGGEDNVLIDLLSMATNYAKAFRGKP